MASLLTAVRLSCVFELVLLLKKIVSSEFTEEEALNEVGELTLSN